MSQIPSKVDGSSMVAFFSFLLAHFFYDMKHAIITRWLANPNQERSFFLYDLQSSYEHLIHYQSEDSCAH